MRILHVLNTNKFSGAEGVVCQIIEIFKDTIGVEMAYCSPDGQIRDVLKERGILFLPVTTLNKENLKKVVDDYQPDVIHAHDMKASFLSFQVVKHQKLIFHIHNNAYDSRKVSLKSLAFLLATKKASHIFWVSDAAQAGYCFKHFVYSKSSVLYNIVGIREIEKYAAGDKNIYSYDAVYLGRLSEEKNPLRLINIFNLVVKNNPSATLAIVGDGNMYDVVKKTISDNHLLNNVFMIGYKKNPYKILKDAKVMIMSSLWEGLPMCALEAQSLGVPIVSTPTDGLKYILKNGENGFVYDNDEKIAGAVSEIISDNALHMKLSLNAKAWSIQHNDIKAYKEKIIDVYGFGS